MKLEEIIAFILTQSEQIEEKARLQSEFGDVTNHQIHCLNSINNLKNPTPTILSKELAITKPSTTAMVEKLVKKDLIKKVPSKMDGRMFHLQITAKGKKIIQWHRSVHAEIAGQITKNLNESEKDILVYLLTKAVADE